MKYYDVIDQVLNRLCIKRSRGSPVKHFREVTDASKVVIRNYTDTWECSVIEASNLVCVCLLMKEAINPCPLLSFGELGIN